MQLQLPPEWFGEFAERLLITCPGADTATPTWSHSSKEANTTQSALDIAIAFLDAWTAKDFETAGRYLADDFVFDGPIAHYRSAQEFVSGSRAFADRLRPTWFKVAAFGDDHEALLLYDLFLTYGCCHAHRRPLHGQKRQDPDRDDPLGHPRAAMELPAMVIALTVSGRVEASCPKSTSGCFGHALDTPKSRAHGLLATRVTVADHDVFGKPGNNRQPYHLERLGNVGSSVGGLEPVTPSH